MPYVCKHYPRHELLKTEADLAKGNGTSIFHAAFPVEKVCVLKPFSNLGSITVFGCQVYIDGTTEPLFFSRISVPEMLEIITEFEASNLLVVR